MNRKSVVRDRPDQKLGISPGAATALSVLFLVVVLGSAGYVLHTMNAVSRSIREVDISAASHEFVLLQAVDNLKESLRAYLDRPTPSSLDTLAYALDVATYEIKSYNRSVSSTSKPGTAVPVDSILNITTRLRRLLDSSSDPWLSLHRFGPQMDDLVGNLQNSYANQTYTAVVKEEDAVRQFGNLTVVTRLVAILILASMVFVTAAIWWQRRYMVVLNRTTDEMERAKSVAEEANHAKSDFLATISHEIRTPLNAITGLVHLALGYEHDSRLLDYLRKIRGSADVLLRIVNEVLDFSKIESRKLELDRIPFSLDEVLEGAFSIIGTMAQEKDLELLFQGHADVPDHLVGDPTRLTQVLINIGANAVKFSDSGDILVSVRLVERGSNRAALRFSVQDHGIGIAEEEQPRIFEAFTQAGSAKDRKRGGTGLGLAISRKLVEMMHGSFEVESSLGEGSTFSFTAGFELPPAPNAVSESRGFDFRGTRALVVDDNDSARRILVQMLEALNITTREAQSGSEALEIVDASEPGCFQVIVVDYMMPGMSGFATASELRKRSNRVGSAKLVMMTRDARLGQAAKEDIEGLDEVLVKPVIPSSLYRTLVRLVGGGATADDSLESRVRENVTPARGAGTRVLVIDDNDLNQQISREILENAGFHVTSAASGGEGLRSLESQTFHAVILDLHMPDMNGYEVTKAIRKRFGHHHLPVVAMTASATSEVRQRCMESGMDDFVPKPVRPGELISKLAKWTSASKPMGEASGIEEFDRVDSRSGAPRSTVLNWDDALARVGGNAALLKGLLRDFHSSHTTAAAELKELLRTGDLEAARGRAHSIKGVAGNLGAEALQAAAAQLEKSLSPESPEEIRRDRLAGFERALDALFAELDSRPPADAN